MRPKNPPIEIWLWIILTLGVYTLPFWISHSHALTLGGYDLAEWVSLHPASQGETPYLLTAFLLRLPLVLLTWLVALYAAPRFTLLWWLQGLWILGLIIAQLPPLEFVQNLSNANYQQQFALAFVSLIGAGMGLSGIIGRWQKHITVGLGIVGALSSIAGSLNAQGMLRAFALQAEVGLGLVGIVGLFGLLVLYRLWSDRAGQRPTLSV